MRHVGSWTKQYRPQGLPQQQGAQPYAISAYNRQAFHHPRTSLGAAGHWIHLLSVAAPLLIPEIIKDPEKKWRALRLASVGAALASEIVWTHKLTQDRRKDEECQANSHGPAP
jgi:hypothetical protein